MNKKKEEIKRKEEAKKQEQKKKDEDQKKKQDNSKSSAVPIVTEPQKKKKKEPQTVSHNGVESASAPWAATDQKKQMQVKSMAEIQAEEHKREQMIKQKERERTEREISMVAIEQAKQEKARSAVKMQSWSTVITKNVPPSTPLIANSSVWGSANQTTIDKQLVQKSTKTPSATVKSNLKNVTKSVSQTVQQTNAMKKAIESRGENKNCNDEFSQWCCKHLATLNKNTIDIPTFVTFLKDVESEFEVKDYIQNYLGDNKEVREFSKQFFDKRLKIQNKQRSSDFVEMKSKNKKRNKMVPLDNKVLGFNVVASERINVGELDLGE